MAKLICGIDEAGRGPVIGPMVLAGVAIEEKDEDQLKALGVKDSKQLTRAKREQLDVEIRKIASVHLEIVQPHEIDSRSQVGVNLNMLEALKAADIVRALSPSLVYVDSPTTPNAGKFGEMILSYLEAKPDIIASHKAENKYPCVAAASIVAKVQRDRIVDEIKNELGFEIGSGYAADEITKNFLEKSGELDSLQKHMRKSWGTYKDLKEKKAQKSLSDF